MIYKVAPRYGKKNPLIYLSICSTTGSVSIMAIKAFGQTYGLLGQENVYFAHIPGEKVLITFGSVSVPHIFIYDKYGALQKEFKGETRIDAILKYINTQN